MKQKLNREHNHEQNTVSEYPVSRRVHLNLGLVPHPSPTSNRAIERRQVCKREPYFKLVSDVNQLIIFAFSKLWIDFAMQESHVECSQKAHSSTSRLIMIMDGCIRHSALRSELNYCTSSIRVISVLVHRCNEKLAFARCDARRASGL